MQLKPIELVYNIRTIHLEDEVNLKSIAKFLGCLRVEIKQNLSVVSG